jgi:GntR family transcriptional regulator
VPQVERREPLHLQVAGHYKSQIMSGALREGDRLPSVRDIRDTWDVGQNVAQRAVEHLVTEGLVTTSNAGTFVAAPRAALGPQQRLRLAAAPGGETVHVTAAGTVPAPAYIAPILGLAAGSAVIRREWVTSRPDGTPHMLSVSWLGAHLATVAPELLSLDPIADPRGAGRLAVHRLGGTIDWGRTGFECRQAKDDGRELLRLRLEPGSYVLAGVNVWSSEGSVIEYSEWVLPAGQVVEADLEP